MKKINPGEISLGREFWDIFTFHRRWTKRLAALDVNTVFAGAVRDLNEFGFGELSGKKVLDLGCGQRFAFALQCAAAGAQTTALDIDDVRPAFLPFFFWRITHSNGLRRALKSTLRRLLFDGVYYRTLEAAAGRPLRRHTRDIRFILADPLGAQNPLSTGSFDLIASNNVLEHIRDIPRLAAEIASMLAPGGIFYAIIHNFYSLSGGHHLDWNFPEDRPSQKVPPWDHLRQNSYSSFQYLNRLPPEGFRQPFAERLNLLLFEERGLEGERFLTTELAAELRQYPRKLLLTRSWCLVCQKN